MLALRPGPEQPAHSLCSTAGTWGLPVCWPLWSASVSKNRATLEDQVGAPGQEQLGLKTTPLQTVVEKRATFACTPGAAPSQIACSQACGPQATTRKAPTQPRWKAHPQRPARSAANPQACATENDPLGGQILARSQAVQPTRATLIRIKIVDLDTERGPLRKGSDALSVTICYRTIKSVLMRFSPTPQSRHPERCPQFPCQPPRRTDKARGLATKPCHKRAFLALIRSQSGCTR